MYLFKKFGVVKKLSTENSGNKFHDIEKYSMEDESRKLASTQTSIYVNTMPNDEHKTMQLVSSSIRVEFNIKHTIK